MPSEKMARKLRVEYVGAIYPLMNRGDRQEPIFRDDEDREARLLGPEQALREYRRSSWPEYLQRPGWRWPWLRVDRVLEESWGRS